MGDEFYRIYIPSYRRADSASTHRTYPNVWYVVDGSEEEAYRKIHPNVVVLPDGVQGRLLRVYNWILENSETENLVLMDDDIWYVGKHVTRRRVRLDMDGLDYLIRLGFSMAEEWGAWYWGVNCNMDKQSYREYTPFSTLSYIGGPFQAHRKSHGLRYDERMLLKEDYDMTLQQVYHYRRVLRFNGYFYTAKQGGSGSGQKGGCATYRNHKIEAEQNEVLRQKWGKKIVKDDTNERSHCRVKGKGKADVNPVIKVPIRGV